MNPPFPHKKTDTQATKFIDRGLESLKKRGVIAAVVPYSLLVRTTDWHRTILCNNNLLFIATLPPDLFSPYASYNTAIIFIEKGIPQSSKKTFVCRIANDGYKLKKNSRISQDGGELKKVYNAYYSKDEIPELSSLADIKIESKEWSPEAYIKNAPHQDKEFLIGLENHIRKHASFYILYGHKLVDAELLKLNHETISTDIFSSLSVINLSEITYGNLSIREYFDVKLGGKDEIEDLEEGDIPIVSTSEFNNGVTSFRKPRLIYNPPVITVATDGSVCSSFVQEFSFYAFYKVAILVPKHGVSIPLNSLYYISYLLFREKWRYVYARKFGKARMEQTNVLVPLDDKGNPDFSLMSDIVQNCQAFCAIKLYRKSKI
jgi:type I restriction enzyme M protein